MFDKVLVANRGEIARRVFRTCRELGIATVAVHTDVDAEAPHVRDADETVRVGSYLDVEEVVAAAVSSGADAVHPGYGFLSERAGFARAVTEAGIVFVGPSAEVIDLMGRKDAAREVAVAAGVPVVPSYDLDTVAAGSSETVAYPVLVKATAGGGGKGMRVVRAASDLPEALAAAGREAQAAFGDDTMLLEKYVERGRHIEVQVVGDTHGHVLHLHERDCSTQRRHQKVLEEAPAPTLGDDVRRRIVEAAVALGDHVGYTGAGTVEFLLDSDTGEFYFLEVNTRLQVEHPVTEAVTGLDLVELQLRVAAGEPLPLRQDDVVVRGHAIEARVYAEDSFAGFLPQAGTAEAVRWPAGVRVDQALESGQTVSTSYDPMLGKVIAHGETRELARQALLEALDDTAILGLTTNTGFLRMLLATDEFAEATIDTAWLDRHDLSAPGDAAARTLAGVVLREELAARTRGPWAADSFRLGGDPGALVEHGRDLSGSGWATGSEGDDGVWSGGLLTHDGEVRGFVRRTRGTSEVVVRGQRFVLGPDDPFRDHVAQAGGGAVSSPMPGTVLDVRVAEGDVVEEGQVLGTVEAMKMELALKAPHPGRVDVVSATVGGSVALGEVLFEVVPEEQGDGASRGVVAADD